VISYLLVALALNLLLGATVTNSSRLLSFGIMAPVVVELLLLGGVWEEPGWSGYGLPKLQAHFAGRPHGLLKASLVMGTLRSVWHIPLAIYGHIPWFDVLLLSFALQFIISWLYNSTRGSVLIIMLFHLTSNIMGGGVLVPLFTGVDHTQYYVCFVGMACVTALLLARANKWSMGRAVEPA
jgi:hypothetical protein